LREVSVLARGYVDVELQMVGDVDPYDARLIFHIQFAETPCVEMVFEDVTELNLRLGSYLKPSGHYSEEAVILGLGKPMDGGFVGLKARRAKYRVLDRSFLGKTPLAVEEIPVGQIQMGLDVGDGWIECPVCSNAVKSTKRLRTVKCDSCAAVLEVPL
jgi:hypothetical protein